MKTLTQIRSLGQRLVKDASGVTAIEYALIAGLIALVIITAVTIIGTTLTATFTAIAAAFP